MHPSTLTAGCAPKTLTAYRLSSASFSTGVLVGMKCVKMISRDIYAPMYTHANYVDIKKERWLPNIKGVTSVSDALENGIRRSDVQRFLTCKGLLRPAFDFFFRVLYGHYCNQSH